MTILQDLTEQWKIAPKDIKRTVTISLVSGVLIVGAAGILWKTAFHDVQFAAGLEVMKPIIGAIGLILASIGSSISVAAAALLRRMSWGRAVLECFSWITIFVLIVFHLLCIVVLITQWAGFKNALLPWEMPELVLIVLLVIMIFPIVSGFREIRKLRSPQVREYAYR
jgi:hypothetical protein